MTDTIYFARPELLWSLSIVAIGTVYFLLRRRDRLLVLSRALVACLLIVSLANPYLVTTTVEEVKRPRITVLADETESMRIFESGVAERLQAALPDSDIRYFTGEATPLGDKILQYAPQADALLVVSDGNNNSGRPMEEALSMVRAGKSAVFALQVDPMRKEVGVEIEGSGTAVSGSDYPFRVFLHAAGGEPQGTLTIYADDLQIYQETFSSSNTSVRLSHPFSGLGTHIIKAVIAPEDDLFSQNNQFLKSVYVVPKPSVLLVTKEGSPLQEVLKDGFALQVEGSLPENLEGYKAVVLDGVPYDPSLDVLKAYVREGGGVVAVGGPQAFELGQYYQTPLEKSLPVVSSPSIFQGGKILLLILDISGSTMAPMIAGQSATYLDYEKSLAIELLRSPELRDARAAVVVFGTKAYVVSHPVPLSRSREVLEEAIKSLQTPIGKDETNLNDGLQLAWDILNASRGEEGELVVISDGRLEPDKLKGDVVFENSADIIRRMNLTTTLIQVQAFEGSTGRFASLAGVTGAIFYPVVFPSSLTVHMGEMEEAPLPEQAEAPSGYGMIITNADHYIVKALESQGSQSQIVLGNISGFNDVTPRPGAQRLVALSDGKPVLTVMRYGLGRSVALSTDNGLAWGGPLYSPPDSSLITASVNWAVGDPRPETNRIDAPHAWKGTPIKIIIASPEPPDLGPGITVERSGEGTYAVTIIPQESRIYYIGDFGIAVNYPLEYRDPGFSQYYRNLIQENQGRIFTEEEARRSLVEEARKSGQRATEARVSQSVNLLLAAMAIFLVEVIWRRIRELRAGK